MTGAGPPLAALAALVRDGDRVVAGGLPLWRKPIALVRAVAAAGRRSLRYSAFLASLDAEILAAAGCLAELEYGYLGRDVLGISRALSTTDDLDRRLRTEFEYWAALRATATGVATLPDAFGRPVPAARYDVCLLHAALIDGAGDVHSCPLDAMEEDDRLLAGAADRVLVTVERRVRVAPPGSVLLLPAVEVTAVAVQPGGARPLGMAGAYPPDLDLIDAAGARP
jgi:glutaconate CoA-transferase subunit A